MIKKYEQLYSELKEKILLGEYRAGEKLPSKRVMTDRTGYSQITVATAYGMLEDEGYIRTRQRSGYYVCEIDPGVILRTGQEIGFAPHLPEPAVEEETGQNDFEYSVWFRTVRKVISEKGALLFQKSPNQGCAVLRNAIADYLRRYRNMEADPARIVIGSGAEQLYETVVKILGREQIYGIEQPCYERIPSVYRDMGARIFSLKMGNEGIERETLYSGDQSVLHVTPFHSYPSGVTTSVSVRYEYLRWAEKTGNYIVEDDFDSEFFMPGHPIESLYSLDRKGSVIYINTFSKSLSPAMRMGYMILPEALMEAYERTSAHFSCSVPVMDQYVLAEFISNGNFERHLNRVRRRMKEKT